MPLVQERAGAPFTKVALDLIGPMPPSRRGKVYLLVMQDCFTKWIEVVAISNKTARVVAAAFANTWVTRYGSPRLLHQDNGCEFTVEVFVELCKLFRITQMTTMRYYPQSNRQVERANQKKQALMKCVCNDTSRDWADVCNWVAATSSPEGATKKPKKRRPVATSMAAAANVAKDVKTRAELRAGLLLTGCTVICGCRNPRTDSNAPRIRAKQNIEHIHTHHQLFRLKIYCPGCPKLLGVDISNEHHNHVGTCVPKLSVGNYADVTFGCYRGNTTYCGERL
jgi:hypothetical protein